jgi:hypothetical protein
MKIIHNNDLKQVSFLDERFYFDGQSQTYLPSVTTILDVYPKGFGYYQWLKDLGSNADVVMERAGTQGSNIHNAIQLFLNGNEVKWVDGEKENYTLEEWLMFLKFIEFYKTFKPETISVEMSLADAELGYGGTLDYVCKINGEIWLLDWKSGNSIHKGNKIQITAYQRLWNKLSTPKIQRIGLVHLKAMTRGLDKSGKVMQGEGWKIEEVTEQEHLYNLFEHAQAIWKEEHPNNKPKNEVYPDRISIKILSENK